MVIAMAMGGRMTNRTSANALRVEQLEKDLRRTLTRGFTLSWTEDVKDELRIRELVIGDLSHVLKQGRITGAEESSREGIVKCTVESKTPNFINKSLRIVIVFDLDEIKVCEILP